MKTILLNSLACAALLFVTACGKDEQTPVTTSTTTTETQQVPAMVPAPATTTTETQQVHTY